MEKFTPYEKLSKKKQRELVAKRRGNWCGLNPVTRKPENSKAYNRKKARKWSDDSSTTVPFDLDYLSRTAYLTLFPYFCADKRQSFSNLSTKPRIVA
ncbi:hypothetical protein [Caproiciproducens sp.]|uniref:hypothetical protein n=1 Tax=Caproiciproducens sp. TaxID=1954376 RepID=UPI0028A2CE86|nr:hypothetical protein [Caproiciproducens sp.]